MKLIKINEILQQLKLPKEFCVNYSILEHNNYKDNNNIKNLNKEVIIILLLIF